MQAKTKKIFYTTDLITSNHGHSEERKFKLQKSNIYRLFWCQDPREILSMFAGASKITDKLPLDGALQHAFVRSGILSLYSKVLKNKYF